MDDDPGLVASMVGVRREGIPEVAGRLQEAGSICSRRGHTSVIDRAGPEGRVCDYCGVGAIE